MLKAISRVPLQEVATENKILTTVLHPTINNEEC